eukprot:m.30502 g.30502  ORF g.30502 m.30502 type:complete len:573 (+) comp8206_c0_seq1:202-1920(+)
MARLILATLCVLTTITAARRISRQDDGSGILQNGECRQQSDCCDESATCMTPRGGSYKVCLLAGDAPSETIFDGCDSLDDLQPGECVSNSDCCGDASCLTPRGGSYPVCLEAGDAPAYTIREGCKDASSTSTDAPSSQGCNTADDCCGEDSVCLRPRGSSFARCMGPADEPVKSKAQGCDLTTKEVTSAPLSTTEAENTPKDLCDVDSDCCEEEASCIRPRGWNIRACVLPNDALGIPKSLGCETTAVPSTHSPSCISNTKAQIGERCGLAPRKRRRVSNGCDMMKIVCEGDLQCKPRSSYTIAINSEDICCPNVDKVECELGLIQSVDVHGCLENRCVVPQSYEGQCFRDRDCCGKASRCMVPRGGLYQQCVKSNDEIDKTVLQGCSDPETTPEDTTNTPRTKKVKTTTNVEDKTAEPTEVKTSTPRAVANTGTTEEAVQVQDITLVAETSVPQSDIAGSSKSESNSLEDSPILIAILIMGIVFCLSMFTYMLFKWNDQRKMQVDLLNYASQLDPNIYAGAPTRKQRFQQEVSFGLSSAADDVGDIYDGAPPDYNTNGELVKLPAGVESTA